MAREEGICCSLCYHKDVKNPDLARLDQSGIDKSCPGILNGSLPKNRDFVLKKCTLLHYDAR